MSSRVVLFSMDDRWLPKSVLCLRDYNLNKFTKDVIAGITVGLVALPRRWHSASHRD
jgi:MFS superfamily sulfate permease-like transporter